MEHQGNLKGPPKHRFSTSVCLAVFPKGSVAPEKFCWEHKLSDMGLRGKGSQRLLSWKINKPIGRFTYTICVCWGSATGSSSSYSVTCIMCLQTAMAFYGVSESLGIGTYKWEGWRWRSGGSWDEIILPFSFQSTEPWWRRLLSMGLSTSLFWQLRQRCWKTVGMSRHTLQVELLYSWFLRFPCQIW